MLDEVLGAAGTGDDVRRLPYGVVLRLMDELRAYLEVRGRGVGRYLAWRSEHVEQAARERYGAEGEEE